MAYLTSNVLRNHRDKNKESKNKVIILMIVVISFFAILEIRPSDKNTKIPSWFGTLQCMSITISELEYGLKGNIGYRKVYDIFYPALEGGDAGVSIIEMNRAINSTLHIEDVSSSGIHYNLAGGAGRGLTEFMKLSFRIFGYKAESFFYLYIALISISIFFFLVSFKNNPVCLFIGLLFVICYYIITTATVVKFETIIGHRFFPLLTILPTIHISLITMDKHKLSISTFVGVFVQTVILIFSFYIRVSSQYQFMFLGSLPIFLFIYNKTHQKFASHRISIKQFYPLYIVLVGMLFYVSMLSENSVAEKNNSYPIWHQIYIGLAGHPQAVEKYGIAFSDITGINLVLKKEAEAGRYIDLNNSLQDLYHGVHPDKTNFPIPGEQYGKIVKSEFFRILQNDPYFVISSFFYKVPLYLKVFFSNLKNPSYLPEFYGNIDGLHKITNLYLMIMVIFAAFLIRKDIMRQWMPYFHLLFLNLVFALIPPIITLPAVHSVLDSGLLLIMLIYLLFARLSLGFIVRFLRSI